MKVFSFHHQNVSTHRRITGGWKFHGSVKSKEELYDMISSMEDANWFPHYDGEVTDCNGDTVVDPAYPTIADFGCRRYEIVHELNDYQKKAVQIDS